MEIKLYNSLGRKKEVLKPIRTDYVGVYTCGPTVYNTVTIGNLRTFIFSDLLVRVLRYNDLDVKYVMNITDVGHLVSDGDDGEDKLEVGARREGKTAWDVAKYYTELFMNDMDRLNLIKPDELPRATDHIEEQIRLVEQMEENGFTYKTSDGIYFDTSKLDDYGSLAGQAVEEKEEGARIGVNVQKRSASDFALWKFSKENEQRNMEWESPWGTGFPGWHLECTAMSTQYLGDLYDIHVGGMDLKMTHHPNEIAQSQGAKNTIEANVWMHGEFLLVDGGKMSKSLGNAYGIDELIEKGFDPLAFRYLTMTAHYRSQLNFTFESLEASSSALKKLRQTVRGWDAPGAGSKKHEERFIAAVSDDLDLPRAIATVWDLVNDEEVSSADKARSLTEFDKVLGLELKDYISKPIVIPEGISAMVKEREVARENKDFDLSDKLRDKIRDSGFIVEDTEDGQRISEL